MTTTIPVEYWQKLPGGRLRCDLCPRHCMLNDGQRGMCYVRRRDGETMVLTTYGRSSGFCIDPIEKKPLNHFLPGSAVLSFGTAGCNLGCRFCQNWDMSKSREMDTLADSGSPEKIASVARDSGCRSIAFTYNDPVIFLEYAIDVAKACSDLGIRTVAVTAGYICDQPRRDFFQHMDAANVDLKAFTESFYNEVCASDLQPVLDTLVYLKQETDVWFEITTLLIPGKNDDDEELHAASEWIMEHLGPDVPWHFTAFHPDYKMMDIERTPAATLSRAQALAKSHGIHHVYTGNVHDKTGQSSVCHACGTRLIGRDWYVLSDWALTDDGNCQACGERFPGVIDGPPGDWGAERKLVHIKG